jgi:hypothetical protein
MVAAAAVHDASKHGCTELEATGLAMLRPILSQSCASSLFPPPASSLCPDLSQSHASCLFPPPMSSSLSSLRLQPPFRPMSPRPRRLSRAPPRPSEVSNSTSRSVGVFLRSTTSQIRLLTDGSPRRLACPRRQTATLEEDGCSSARMERWRPAEAVRKEDATLRVDYLFCDDLHLAAPNLANRRA